MSDYQRNSTKIKQADAIMLSYPLNWNMSRDIMRNDLEYYENLMSPRTPAMTKSFYAIGWKFINEMTKASSYFLSSYQDYQINPFKVSQFCNVSFDSMNLLQCNTSFK